MTTCTLTFIDDHHGEYEDDLLFQREVGHHIIAGLGGSALTRDVVRLLMRWLEVESHCRRPELIVLGKCLYEIAFGGGVPFSDDKEPRLQRAFETTFMKQKQERNGQPLRLRLVIMPAASELGKYPWEFLYMSKTAADGVFLAGEEAELHLTRYVPNTDYWVASREAEDDGRLRILIVESEPRIPGMTDLDVEEFVMHLEQLDPKRFAITPVPSPTRDELKRELTRIKPHVVHFIGHGSQGKLALRLSDKEIAAAEANYQDHRERGLRAEPVSEADWIDVFTARGLLCHGLGQPDTPQRLVFVHACEGASQTQTRDTLDVFTNLARTLADRERVTAVVAMQYAIHVGDAEQFAKSFYHFIAEGLAPDAAAAAARQEFAGGQAWDDRRFGTPVVYLRRGEPLLSAPAHVGRKRDTGQEQRAQPTGKEPCPNPYCDAPVLRTSKHKVCRVCLEPFVECPAVDCGGVGLVVSKPGKMCNNCEYVVPSAAILSEPSGTRASPPTTADPGRSSWTPLPRDPSDNRSVEIDPRGPYAPDRIGPGELGVDVVAHDVHAQRDKPRVPLQDLGTHARAQQDRDGASDVVCSRDDVGESEEGRRS